MTDTNYQHLWDCDCTVCRESRKAERRRKAMTQPITPASDRTLTDRELLESLGYRLHKMQDAKSWKIFRPDGSAHWNGDERDWYDREDDAIHDVITDRGFWEELDSALAERGWETYLHNLGTHFTYRAERITENISDAGRTRLEAVRKVFEQIITKEGA